MIDVDNLLYTLSTENDIHRKNNTSSYALDIIYETAKKYEFKNGDYNAFVEAIKRYLKNRYSFDFYRLSPDENLANEIDSLKRKR